MTELLAALRAAGAWWDGNEVRRDDWYPDRLDPALEAALRNLLAAYRDELAELDRILREVQDLIGSGATQFADAEGAILYCAVRELRPDVVFEISPASGWSTNHILAALTKNGTGVLHSFELATTEARLRANIHPALDQSSLEVHIGDARETVPSVPGQIDVVLLDSAHEAWFAEWYLAEVLPRVRGLVAIHDIVRADGGVKHERYYDGEAYAVLEWLARSGVRAAPAFPLEARPPEERRLPVDSFAIFFGAEHPPAPAASRPRELLRRADVALAAGDTSAVDALLMEVREVADARRTPHLVLQLAERYRRLGRIDEARDLVVGVGRVQDEPLWLWQAGRTLWLLGRPFAGAALLQRAARRSNAPAWIKRQAPDRRLLQALRR